mgnify:CR=1 FL=1
MYLVDRIIERCENSSRDWREGVTGGRTLRITQEDYDACGKEELIEEVQRLERAGLLTVKKWVVPDSDVEACSISGRASSGFLPSCRQRKWRRILAEAGEGKLLYTYD